MVHLENAALAGRAMVGAVGLAGLAFLTKPELAVRLDGEGGGARRSNGRQGRVAHAIGSTTRLGEDGRGVAPVEHRVEDEGAEG